MDAAGRGLGALGAFDDLLSRKGSGTPYDGFTTERPGSQEPDTPPWDRPPADYVAFLGEVGFGTMRGETFVVYSGLIDPEWVYDRASPEFDAIRIFGDDMAGYSVGFQLPDWRLVELDARGRVEALSEPDFQTFIRSKIAREDEIMAGQGEAPQ